MNHLTAAALRVLVVDDEASVVNSVRRELMLSPVGHYVPVVEGFTDTDDALQRAREADFAIVITDFRMPKRNGLEFLKALQAIQPWIEAIVLSGDTDIDSLVKMINDTHIYRFIPKPWQPDVLRNTIVQAAELRRVSVQHRKLAEMLTRSGVGLVHKTAPGTDTVLVIDDDDETANAIRCDLEQSSLLFDILGAIDLGHGADAAPVLDSSRLRVEVARTAEQALAVSSGGPVSCVIAGYRSGSGDGLALLGTIAAGQPDAALLVWSESARMDELVSSLNVARIQGFMSKPWQAHELRAVVAQALSYRRIHLDNQRLAEHLARLGVADPGL